MPPTKTEQLVTASLTSRRRKEQSFKLLGIAAIIMALFFLVTLMTSILSKGLPGFFQYYITLEVELDRERLDPLGDLSDQSLFDGQAKRLVQDAILSETGASSRKEKKAARKLLSNGSDLRLMSFVQDNPDLLNSTQTVKFALDDDADSYFRGFVKKDTPEKQRR